jgi:hypothetical protein
MLPVALSPGVFTAYTRNEYQREKSYKYPGSRVRPVSEADLTNCEPIVYAIWDP